MYALIINNTIEAVQSRLPRGADADGQWIEPVTEANAASCGWFPVVDTLRPADTDTHTHDRSVELVNGTPTVVWTQRPWTAEDLAALAEQANEAAIDAYLNDALALIDTITSRAAVPFTQQGVRDVQGDCKDLGRILRRIIRKQLRKLDAAT
jgi:hypothetical protein